MVSLVDYKDYLRQQYERIERKVLSDASIPILKQLENKEHLFKRLTEIFEKTFNAQRENLVERLLRDNHRLREKVDSATLDESESEFRLPAVKSHSSKAIEENSMERARLLKKNEELVRQIESLQQQESRLVEGLRRQVEQLKSKLAMEQRSMKEREDSQQQLSEQQQDLFSKLREELEATTIELTALRKLKNKGKDYEASLKDEIELLKNKLARVEVENCNYLSELEDLQGQLARSKAIATKKDSELKYLEEARQEMQKQCEKLQRFLKEGEHKQGQRKSLETSELRITHERLEVEFGRLSQDLKRTKRELEKSRKETLEYRSLYEEAVASLNDNRLHQKLEDEVAQLRQQLNEAQSNNRRQLDAETVRLLKLHDEESTAKEREYQRQLETAKRKLELKLKEKEIECEQLSKDLAHCSNNGKESATSLECLRREVEELRENRKHGSLRDNNELTTLKKNAVECQNKLDEKRRECDELRSKIQNLVEENSKLGKKLRNIQTIQIVQDEEQSDYAELQRKQSIVQNLKDHLHSKTALVGDLENKLDSTLMETAYLKTHVEELTTKLEQQRRTINLLEDSKEQARKASFLLEVEHKKMVEQLVQRFGSEAEETKQFYIGQLKHRPKNLLLKKRTDCEQVDQSELKLLLQDNYTLKRQLEQKTLQSRSLERQLSTSKEELEHAADKHTRVRAEYESMLELAKGETRRTLSLLTQYETRISQHRIKFAEFKREIGVVMHEILLGTVEQLATLKDTVKALRYQISKEVSEVILALQSKILAHQRALEDSYEYRTKRSIEEVEYRHLEQLKEIKVTWEHKLNQQALNSLTALTEKELRQRQLQQKLDVSEKSLQSTLQHSKELEQKTEALDKLVVEHKQLNSRLERRTRELQEQLTLAKDHQRKQQMELARESQRVRRLERECQQRLQTEQRKYSQDNFDMFRRYEKELQKVVQQTASSPNGAGRISYGPWDTPQRHDTENSINQGRNKELIDSIRQEILLQRSKLQSLERSCSPTLQSHKPTKSTKPQK